MVQKKKPARPRAPKAAKLSPPKTPVWRITPEQQIVGATFLGKVLDYYSHPGVAVLILEAPLAAGEMIRIKGHTTDLTQRVEHMEVEHRWVNTAAAGEGVGIKLADKVRRGDAVYKI